MFGRLPFKGRTSWTNWLRRPRLNKAVHRVATLTCISFARVESESFGGMAQSFGK